MARKGFMKKNLKIFLPDELHGWLQEEAEKEFTSMAELTRRLLVQEKNRRSPSPTMTVLYQPPKN